MKLKAFRTALPYTIPIFTGFFFLGFTYGIYMNVSGFSFIYPMLMSLTIFGGSLEFLAVSMLLSPFAPLQVFITAFLLQARHLFYGISMLEKYRNMGLKKLYLIFGMCDESFSINYTADIPPDVDKGWFMFFVNLLNQMYWVISSTLGGILGSFIKFDTEGIEFVMTAMFTVIFLEQYLKEKIHLSSFLGIIASVLCLNIFGPDSFLIPTMVLVFGVLTAFRNPLERLEEKRNVLS